jgi:hypothetical protein
MGTASDSQKVDTMSIILPHVYFRSFIVVSVLVSTLDKKYNGLPVASMKMGYLMWLNTETPLFKTLAVADD